MKHLYKLIASILAVALLSGCGMTGTKSESPKKSTTKTTTLNSGNIAYVPLDDRPDNVERVEYLANSLGFTVKMPDEDLYKTYLDNQGTNSNGTQYGNRGALYEWVQAQERSGCHQYILSLDQLLSGGLVNSRHMTKNESVSLSNGSSLTESQMIKNLLTMLSANPDNQVWLLDSVMRLAPTMGYAGFDLDGYNTLRSYGIQARPELSGDELTVDRIAADYPLGADGQKLKTGKLSDTIIWNYLAARKRKLQLSNEVQQILCKGSYQNFHLLIGIDDSSTEDSIQKNEISLLRRNLRSEDALLSGVDDMGFKAVTKLYLEKSGWSGDTAYVSYFGGTEKEAACDYDYRSLKQLVNAHLSFFGLSRSSSQQKAGLQILVLTRPKNEKEKATYYQDLIAVFKDNEKHERPTILIDAGNGEYGTAFHDALVKKAELGRLLGYSGFLDMAIVTGTALSNGVARYAWLKDGNKNTTADKAFLQGLSDSIIKDFCYKNTVRNRLISYVQNELNGSPDNFKKPKISQKKVLKQLETIMPTSIADVLNNFSHSNAIVSLSPYKVAGCGTITLSNYSFPWMRVFEIRMRINVGDFTNSHKKILGIFTA